MDSQFSKTKRKRSHSNDSSYSSDSESSESKDDRKSHRKDKHSHHHSSRSKNRNDYDHNKKSHHHHHHSDKRGDKDKDRHSRSKHSKKDHGHHSKHSKSKVSSGYSDGYGKREPINPYYNNYYKNPMFYSTPFHPGKYPIPFMPHMTMPMVRNYETMGQMYAPYPPYNNPNMIQNPTPSIPISEPPVDKIVKDQNFLNSDDKLFESIINSDMSFINLFAPCQFSEKLLGPLLYKTIKKIVFDPKIELKEDEKEEAKKENKENENMEGILESALIDTKIENLKHKPQKFYFGDCSQIINNIMAIKENNMKNNSNKTEINNERNVNTNAN
ncbi:MAG: hypothetical protein MJ252_19860 [archaeon]|nr:hypothetical protein [archaeon]